MFLEQTSKTLSEKGDVKYSAQLADEAAALYERALGGFMKKNMLLHFAFADYEESRLKYQKVHQVVFLIRAGTKGCGSIHVFMNRGNGFFNLHTMPSYSHLIACLFFPETDL